MSCLQGKQRDSTHLSITLKQYLAAAACLQHETPHYVYLAYFSKQHIKAGISSETRGIERLLGKEAVPPALLGASNAYEARVWRLHCSSAADAGNYAYIGESAVAEEPYKAEEACEAR